MIEPIKFYSILNNRDTILELWGSSTKYPDLRFHFRDSTKSLLATREEQTYQWLIECSSRLELCCHTKEIVDFANKYYNIMRNNKVS